ncbi:olfactory receptor 5V1-like [Manis pentadactyla]|uniref:olfactory receptor 5V1-like n=1 Tax=Manis pentadactyla TaxID=143292 RepID=UPI00255C8AD0|nr:olfactory receptor 5V1-like [Manis pentadactyla]
MRDNIMTGNHSISFLGSALQVYFLEALVRTEFFLLSVMACDRYVAMCFPLQYNLIMTKARCALLTAGTWAAGILNSLLHTVSTFCLSFCKSNRINQYYCDIPLLVALSCSSKFLIDMVVFVGREILGIDAFLTFISYIYIISAILKIQSVEGKHKAFSTCASHLLVVCLFYGTATFTYMQPSSGGHSTAGHSLTSCSMGLLPQC